MITINQRNIWYILLFVIDSVLIYCCFNYDLKVDERTLTGMGAIVMGVSLVHGFLGIIFGAITMLKCFDDEIQFEYKIPLPFYSEYVKYKVNKEIKLRKIDLLHKAVISLREGDEQQAERILIEYNKLEL